MLEDVPRIIAVPMLSLVEHPGWLVTMAVLAVLYFYFTRPLNIIKVNTSVLLGGKYIAILSNTCLKDAGS
jgi:hypothetical protein